MCIRDRFRDRTPTSIVYLADEEDVDAAFVGFASGPQPLVQVLPGLSSGNSDCTAETCAVLSIQRMFVSEQVSLMKGFSLDIEGSDDAASLLLVTGRQVAEPSTAPSAAAAAGGGCDIIRSGAAVLHLFLCSVGPRESNAGAALCCCARVGNLPWITIS